MEELIYPGSANAEEIKNAAREALDDSSFQWNAEEKDACAQLQELKMIQRAHLHLVPSREMRHRLTFERRKWQQSQIVGKRTS